MQLQPLEVHLQEIVIERERRGDVGAAGERHQADAIPGTFIDELLQDIPGDLQAVDPMPFQLEVLRFHAAGEIDRHDDVDSAGLDRRLALDELGPGQTHDEEEEEEPPERGEHAAGGGLADAGHAAHELDGGIEKGRRLRLPAPPPGHRRQEEQEQKKPGMSQGHAHDG